MKTVTPNVKPHARNLPLKVGTRGSPLARQQTATFLALLKQFCPVLRGMEVFEEHIIVTTGDAVQNRPLAEIGGKGLFAKEIHESLAEGRIDFAVHSLKDLETVLPPGIALACTLKREDARDVLILPPGTVIDPADPYGALPNGAHVGSASVRRQSQLKYARPDLNFTLLRGNVGTRLGKVESGELDATLLAYAGLRRLGLAEKASVVLSPEQMVPSACQGIVGITVREADTELLSLLSGIEDPEAKAVSTAERALLNALDGSCRTPIGGYARLLEDGSLHLTGLVARVDGSFLLKRTAIGAAKDAEALGRELGRELKADSPTDIFLP
ncbi:MAG: hydroxymethylbilane synthase [Acidocella sp.]|nr:hydroxymethylbilane synthase [Acidocella sp.]